MILDSQRATVERLLEEGLLTCQQIAVLAGVSRTTLWAIASGRRSQRLTAEDQHAEASADCAQPPQRCRGCGGLVYPPCRLCYVRSLSRADLRRKLR